MTESSEIAKKNNTLYFLFLLMIIVISAAIRSYTLNNNYMWEDELNHFIEARNYSASHQIPVIGPGLYGTGARIPGGAYFGILSLFGYLSNQPIVFSWLSFSLFLFASLVFIWTIKKCYGTFPALIIMGFMLASPTFLGMESRIWNPNFAALFSLLLVSCLLEIFSGNDHPILMFILLPLSAVIGQCHFSAIFYLPLALIIYFIFFYRDRNRVYFWLGIAGAVLLYIPYLMSELNNGFENTRKILTLSSDKGELRFPVLTFLFLLPSIDMTSLNSGEFLVSMKDFLAMPWYLVIFVFPAAIISILFSALSFIYTFILILKTSGKNKISKVKILFSEMDSQIIRFTFLLIGVMTLVFMIFKFPSESPHYYYPVYAFCFIPLLYGIRYFTDNLKWRHTIVMVLSLWIMISGALASYTFFKQAYEPISITNQIKYSQMILDDSSGRTFTFKPPQREYFYKTIASVILKRDWKSAPNAGLIYYITGIESLTDQDKLALKEASLLSSNNWIKLYRINK